MNIEELYQKISSQPSILFLGQSYLSTQGEPDAFLEMVNDRLFNSKEINLDYKTMCKLLESRRERIPGNTDIDMLHEIAMDMPEQIWLKKILDLKWSTIYTSAIDGVIERKTGERSVTSIYDESNYPRNLMSKKQQHCTYLYQSLFSPYGQIPVTGKELRSAKVTANKLLSRISDDLIKNYGVFVIEGWNPNSDFVTAEQLLDNLFNFHHSSVYMFSATQEVMENEQVQALIECGILQTDVRSLYECLLELDCFKIDEDNDFTPPDADEGVIITLNHKYKNKTIPKHYSLSYRYLRQMDSSIHVLDDSVLIEPYVTDRLGYFVRFLSTGHDVPFWTGYKAGFYFERDIYKYLEEAVYEELKQDSITQRVIILEGQCNSGKTAVLGKLAMKLKEDLNYPVIYITSDMEEEDEYTSLKSLIKDHFINRMKAERVIVIWDKNVYQNVTSYKKLRDSLADSKALIIGSSYWIPADHYEVSKKRKGKSGNYCYITINEQLYEDENDHINEMQNLRNVILSISEDYVHKFDKIHTKISKEKSKIDKSQKNMKSINDYHLFLILQRLFQYEYRPDMIEMKRKQIVGLTKESVIGEEAVDSFLHAYQIKLRYGGNAEFLHKIDNLDETQLSDDHRVFSEGMRCINSILAVAGQFDLGLPFDLLLRVFKSTDKYLDLLLESLEHDSMIRFFRNDNTGEIYLKFRHAFEAEKYLEYNLTEKDGRKKREIDYLHIILENTKFDYESEYNRQETMVITELIRKFGPNGPGNEGRNGEEGSRFIYQDYFTIIADWIGEYDKSDNPDLALVRAHFLREAYSFKESDEVFVLKRKKNMEKARDILDAAIAALNKRVNGDTTKLMAWLQVELASNLVRTLPDNQKLNADQIKVYNEIIKLLNNTIKNGELSYITLDVYLNTCIKRCRESEQDDEWAAQLARATEVIDKTPNLEEVITDAMLRKIIEINQMAQKVLRTEALCKNLTALKKDTAIYLEARSFWKRNGLNGQIPKSISYDELREWDLYYISSYDPTEEKWDTSKDTFTVRQDILHAAQKTVDFFELPENMKIVESSARCLSLYIRSKWIALTGNDEFKLKQHPKLTSDEWSMLASYCNRYYNLHPELLEAFPLFLRAVYQFCFATNNKDYITSFKELRESISVRRPRDWFPNFIYWCDENGRPLQVQIGISTTPDERFRAELVTGVRRTAHAYFPETLRSYFELTELRSYGKLEKPCAIGFNLNGPIIAPLTEREK